MQDTVLTLLRQKRISAETAMDIRSHLHLLARRADPVPCPSDVERIWEIATHQMMTYYDAAYVELAARLELPLASDDSAIKSAAKKRLGLKLL